MVPSLRAALAIAALCGLAVYGFRSAAAANGDANDSLRTEHARTASGRGPSRATEMPARTEPPRAAVAAPPDDPGEGIGSAALERELDQLEKNIQSSR